MNHRAIRIGTGAVALMAVLAILTPGTRVLQAISEPTYRQAQNEAQQPQDSERSGQIGVSSTTADPSPDKTDKQKQDGHGLDWPAIVQAFSAVVSAYATIRIFRVTSDQAKIADGQLGVTRRQAVLSRQQLRLSQQEAAYSRRPHFRVRFARLVKVEGKMLTEGAPVTVMLDVLNNGQADAVIIRSHFEIYWTNTGLSGYFPWFDRSRLNDFATKGEKGGLVIAGDGNLDIEMSGYRIMGSEAHDVEWGRSNWTMFLLGWIGYQRTDNESKRFFDFGLQLQPGTGRFLPMDDPDYSHDPDGK